MTIFLAMPVVGGVTEILTSKLATRYGRSFMQIGPQSLLLLGIIGAVHNFASFYLLRHKYFKFEDGKYLEGFTKVLILSSAITGTVLFALSAIAARVNLISAGLTPFGGAALIVTGFIGNYLTAYVGSALYQRASA